MIDLVGYRVLVTGGSRGIGAACCRLFAKAGATVMVQYLASGARAAQVLKEIGERTTSMAPEDDEEEADDPNVIEIEAKPTTKSLVTSSASA